MKPLAVTPGDPDGIGPEVVWKTIREVRGLGARLLCVGARRPFQKLGAKIVETSEEELRLALKSHRLRPPTSREPVVWLLPAPEAPSAGLGNSPSILAGFQSGWSIKRATGLVQRGLAAALVTGPISKERLTAAGYHFPGHTEFLAHLCGKKSVTMMLANDTLRVSLVTTHLALQDVPRALTQQKIISATKQTFNSLRTEWGIARPRVAIAALNPHAGESGLFGREEIEIICPAIRKLRKSGYSVAGPFPADTLFARHVSGQLKHRFNAIVCMYHDQGLIPVKLLDFGNSVNITLGLPIIRTSVDHGVGFDIAGSGRADPSSFRAAVKLAERLSRRGRPGR
ncbi:MAG TPA: 4-hydroxythreonine-4-phosphate dehydrogenase PdxA [Bdellovibrionota bacterium]|nr:4-hydroxythreonine-4-phosphate dehydrogenase PdxA [Bdellovibrionota bacterium]